MFRGPADRGWWHVVLGDDTASWTMDVRVDEITGVRFVRRPYPFPSFPGREVLTLQFLGPGGRIPGGWDGPVPQLPLCERTWG